MGVTGRHARAGEHQALNPVGVGVGEGLRDDSTHGCTHKVNRFVDAEVIQQLMEIACEEVHGVWTWRLVAATGPSVVEGKAAIGGLEVRGLEAPERRGASQPRHEDQGLTGAFLFEVEFNAVHPVEGHGRPP